MKQKQDLKTTNMKSFKYIFFTIATLGLLASFYNAWYEWSIVELLEGAIPSAFLFYIALNSKRVNRLVFPRKS